MAASSDGMDVAGVGCAGAVGRDGGFELVDGAGGRGRKRGGDPGDGVGDGRVDKRPSLLRGGDLLRSRRLAVVIGPKGGVSPSAVASSTSAKSAGCCPVLGPTALRAALQQAAIDGVDVDQCRV